MSFWLAAVIGFLTAVVCASLQNLNDWLNIDEGLEVFKLHGIGGMMGSFLTGIFADETISALDGASRYPGGINGNGVQVGKQFAGKFQGLVVDIMYLTRRQKSRRSVPTAL